MVSMADDDCADSVWMCVCVMWQMRLYCFCVCGWTQMNR